MRAKSWLGSDSGLSYLEFGNDAVFIMLNYRLQSVYTRGLKPKLRPAGEISARLALELHQEVIQFGVLPLVLLEVATDTAKEWLLANPGDELL